MAKNKTRVEYQAENGIQKHPIIIKKTKAWDEIEALLDQDEDKMLNWFPIQFPNEDEKAFRKRKEYFIRSFVNTAQDLVQAPVNSVFRQEIVSRFGNDNSILKTFSENVVLGNNKVAFESNNNN